MKEKRRSENRVIFLGRLIPDSGKIHQNQEVYANDGIACTIKATHYKDPPKILVEDCYGRTEICED